MFPLGLSTSIMVSVKLLLAAFLGIVIGLDREKSGKPAGIRTQMLVCLGSALLASVSVDLIQVINAGDATTSVFRLDPARLMAQIVSGVGFLGAGVILKNGNKVQGVTTAATIWITAAVGIAIGTGFFIPAAVTTVLVLTLNPLAKLQYKYGLKGDFYTAKTKLNHQNTVEEVFDKNYVDVRQRSVAGKFIIFQIHSSEQKNAKIIETLKKKKIPFEFKISME